MSTNPLPPKAGTGAPQTRLELAARLFREYYSSCFWHYRPDLPISQDTIPLVIQGLRHHGGRQRLLAAARLTSLE
jgi:hypothetical protein